jgi:hypothetical protein
MPDLNGPSATLPNTSFNMASAVAPGVPGAVTQGDITSKTTTATLTAAELATGIVSYTGAGHTLTLPAASDLDTAFPQFPVNGAFDFTVIATTGTATLAVGTGITAVGRLTTAASTASRYRLRKTAVGAWTIYLLA